MTPEDFPPAGMARQRPQVDALGFDHRLMTPARQLQLAGPVRMVFSHGGVPVAWLDCADCGKGVEQLTDSRGAAYPVTGAQLLAAVLRHQVMRHGQALSGAGAGDGS